MNLDTQNNSPFSIVDLKKTLRNEIRDREKALSGAYRYFTDFRIVEKLFSLPDYKEAYTIMAYYSMPTEINTVPILQNILLSGKALCLPLCKSHRTLEAREVKDLKQTKPGVFDIPEPTDECPVIGKSAIDLIIVPCMSCDRTGNRLGHGGGYYDRFLSGYAGQTVVLCREDLMTEHIPTEELDVPVGIVVTEKEIYRR